MSNKTDLHVIKTQREIKKVIVQEYKLIIQNSSTLNIENPSSIVHLLAAITLEYFNEYIEHIQQPNPKAISDQLAELTKTIDYLYLNKI